MKQRPIVVWCSDLHVNDLSSLCPPHFRRDEGSEHVFSPQISKLWDAWLDAWSVVKKMHRQTIVIFGGEFGELDAKSRSNHLITHNRAEIKNAVMDTLDIPLKVASAVIVLRGTEAHSDKEGNFDEDIAKDISGVTVIGNEETGEMSRWVAREKIGGKVFNLAHHVSMGGLPWTEKNAANKLASIVKNECMDWGEPLPDWVMRGHVHRVSDSGLNYFPMRAVTAPCWSLDNPYIHRIGQGNRKPEIGLLVVDTETNDVKWVRYEVKRIPYHVVQ